MDKVNNGVFLHSRNLDSEFMVKCLQVLMNIFPEVRMTTIESDELHFGFRVYFSSPSDADRVLGRKRFTVSGESVPIGPLSTLLTIQSVRRNGGQQFDAELRETICNKFGRLLGSLDPVTNSATFLQINVRACVDAPELEDLEVFKDEMFICLPSNNEMLRVTFHCRRCENDGHVQQKCPSRKLDDDEACMTDCIGISDSPSSCHSFAPSSENIDDDTSSSDDFSSTASSFPAVFPSLSHNTADPSSCHLDTLLKTPTRSVFFAPTSTTAVQVTNTPPTPTAEAKVTNTATTPKIEAEVTNAAATLTRLHREEASLNEDFSSIPINLQGIFPFLSNNTAIPSSSRNSATPPKPPNRNIFFTPTTAAGATHAAPKPTTSVGDTSTPLTPTSDVVDTGRLSLQLQQNINIACEEIVVIDRVHLDNFFKHVKNKSNVLQIAKEFTSNVGKLIKLLQRIINLYYTTQPPQASTEDDRFIKWLKGLVDRLEGTILWRDETLCS